MSQVYSTEQVFCFGPGDHVKPLIVTVGTSGSVSLQVVSKDGGTTLTTDTISASGAYRVTVCGLTIKVVPINSTYFWGGVV